MNVEVKIRSASEPVDAEIVEQDTGGIRVSLKNPISSVAPGQACVFYQGRRVLVEWMDNKLASFRTACMVNSADSRKVGCVA